MRRVEKMMRMLENLLLAVSIVSWNIKGLNSPNKQEDLMKFLYVNKVGLIGLLETKVKVHNVERVAAKVFP